MPLWFLDTSTRNEREGRLAALRGSHHVSDGMDCNGSVRRKCGVVGTSMAWAIDGGG